MKKIYSLAFWILFVSSSYSQDKYSSFEIRTGLQGQFYFKMGRSAGNIRYQEGGNGEYASLGGGIPISYIQRFKKLSISLSPVIRFAKLESPNFANYNPDDTKWGLTIDTHLSLQWKLKDGNWLTRNTSLGTGISVFNIGQPFHTHYGWYQYPSPTYHEFQAKTTMYWGLNALYERKLGEKLYLKFMAIYSHGDWIKYTPFTTYAVLGNISLQYRVFRK